MITEPTRFSVKFVAAKFVQRYLLFVVDYRGYSNVFPPVSSFPGGPNQSHLIIT